MMLALNLFVLLLLEENKIDRESYEDYSGLINEINFDLNLDALGLDMNSGPDLDGPSIK